MVFPSPGRRARLLFPVLLLLAIGGGILLGNRVVAVRNRQAMNDRAARVETGEATKLRAGQMFPPLRVMVPGGGVVELPEALRGRPALVVVVSLECGPCLEALLGWAEAPDSPGASSVVAVCDDPPEAALDFAGRVSFPFPLYADAGRVLREAYDVTVYPTVVGLDETGLMVFVSHGIGPAFSPEEGLRRIADESR
jgi:hypothetical protein